jgi:aminoglycoside phosphotransferase (APT) family kinase protein
VGRQGVRSEWGDVPRSVRADIDELLGSPVIATSGVAGGFSPGPAVRADLADGRRVFIKAAGKALNELSPAMHRREAEVLALLPISIPAPRLLGVVDDGDWVALTIQWIEGRTPLATDPVDVQRLLDLLERVADGAAGVRLRGVATFEHVHRNLLGQWIRLIAEPVSGLDEWSLRHLDRLAELDALAPASTAGSHLVHVDVRTDNVLLADRGPAGDVLVDWPGASLGAPWIDLVGLLPALHLDGGPPPADVFAAHPIGRAADPLAVNAFIASLAGYFTRQSLLPPPPGLPTLRAFQSAQGEITRRWLARRIPLR